jgi:flagellar FliL protein
MADKKEKEEGAEEAPKKSKKMLFIIIGVVLVLVIGGAGAFFMLGGKKKAAEGEEEEAAAEEEAAGDHGDAGGHGKEGGEHGGLSGSIVPLDTFIVNLQVKGSFLKTTIQLEFGEPGQPHTLESDMPKVRDAIIRIMSGKTAQEILVVEGKEKLREEIKDGVNNAMGSEDVVNVYFTEFIVQ